MTPGALLDKLEKLNVKFTINGDKLRLEAPKGVLTPEMKGAVRKQKRALITLLEAQEARELLEKQGWVAVDSKVLGETVLWLKDDNVVYPSRLHNLVKYTLHELKLLTSNPDLTPEGLRRLHKAKKIFQGKIKAVIP
ncbi:MAG: hypothetical protein WAO30_02030 [Thermacetogeniaceae bacterium]|jgi:hypothetical protein